MKCRKCFSENVVILDEYYTTDYCDEGYEVREKNTQYECKECNCIFTIVR